MSEQTKDSLVNKTVAFFRGCNAEIRKVTYPTKDETVKATAVTIILLGIISIALALMDLVLNVGMTQILSR
jgi:preprotein translocase subunit SecE